MENQLNQNFNISHEVSENRKISWYKNWRFILIIFGVLDIAINYFLELDYKENSFYLAFFASGLFSAILGFILSIIKFITDSFRDSQSKFRLIYIFFGIIMLIAIILAITINLLLLI
ncbi:MAG: hypothetical protein CO001_00880 [Candidatus Portnoybacteria bacterium CG_4_8_14_3_um_filter_40_10]|uniref:Uncharacterized protein n=4 Tax=Candidatus Portnoyibacteriota TaxID=1817913 RepID=A0A2M7IJ51_9BACT|nr:MAG: hypothetical protein COV84_01110 [Candidatus Portnoybacteria bacterium CG11_big_fil_rev_8_21_14_0_20_40_15]PIS30026.1 MAG: hypothetical protein COT41_03860 [Candidatus Portnoybacteria bacterium CG08_land_8_20_14_0_20_40_83]PIW76511.1 MAG: hypothetical protein CO001_00880 [Candidatus Portnoybacteria bacterium CG_4_8_14_3_um_filter_40_10]PIY74057.1 MAG: hypothetical protein COY85_04335 [Candidatus Portnoybacteria bacterium CG_4_10_14_0_8_um_filter_40_50]PJA64978.1 MAG: hypothetical protei